MKDLYGYDDSINPRSSFTPTNPRDAGNGINIAAAFPADEWTNFDWLSNRYPKYKNIIQDLRNRGIPDNIISRVFVEQVEPRLNFINTPEQVNTFLGRTPKSMNLDRRFEEARTFDMYRRAFPDKSDQDISNAIWLAQDSGISASSILKYPQLVPQIAKGRPLNYQWVKDNQDMSWTHTADLHSPLDMDNINYKENVFGKTNPIVIGANNYITQRNIANIGAQYWKGKISREEAWKQEQELSQNFLPEPINQSGFVNRAFQEASKILTQGFYTSGKAGLAKLAAMPIGALAGAYLGMPAEGAKFTGNLAALLVTANELWELEAGSDMLEYSKMKDENGNPIDENAARAAAAVTGTLTVLTEMAGLATWGGKIPFLRKVLGLPLIDGITRQNIINAVGENAIVRQAFADAWKQYAKGVGMSTVNNLIETIGHDLGIPLAQAISGQKFPANNIPYAEHISDTITTSLMGFGLSGLPGLVTGLYHTNNLARDYTQITKQISEQSGLTVPEVEQLIIKELQKTQGEQPAQEVLDALLPPTKDETPEATQLEVTQPEATQDTTPEIQNIPQPEISPSDNLETSEQPQTEQPQIKHPHDNADYVFVPTRELNKFLAENKNLTLQGTFSTGDETAIPREQFDTLRAEHPEFSNSILNDIRYEADGVTLSEAKQKIDATDPAQAKAFYSDEIQNGIEQARENYIHAGSTEEQANDAAMLFGAIAASIKAKTGVVISPIEIHTQEDILAEQKRANDMSRINSEEYDINNPATWTDQNRAKRLMEAAEKNKLTNMELFIKRFLELTTSKNTQNEDIELENVDEATKSTMTSEIRAEMKDYSASLKTANQDALDTLSTQVWDAERYEPNTKFPQGKNKNPDRSFEFPNYDGKTTIDLAENNGSLYIKVKRQGIRNPFVFAIKDFRNADFRSILDDLAQSTTDKGVELGKIPVIQNIAVALSDYWQEQGLPKINVNQLHFDPISAPEVHTIDQEIDKPEIHSDFEKISPPEVHAIQRDLNYPNVYSIDTQQDTLEVAPEEQNLTINKPNTTQAPVMLAPMPENTDSNMPGLASYNLNTDYTQWGDTVEDILTDPSVTERSSKQAYVMQTPLVLTLVGADRHQLTINKNKLAASADSIQNKHKTVTLQDVKDIPPAIIDPIAVIESAPSATHSGKLILTEMQDENGASIIVPVHLDYEGKAAIAGTDAVNKIASVYPMAETKGKKKGMPKNDWFRNQALEGRLLYINTDKAAQWFERTGVSLTDGVDLSGVKTEKDLQAAWNEHQSEGYYKKVNGQPVSRININAYGKAIVELLTSGRNGVNYATHVHDIGHALFGFIDSLAEQGVLQMENDRNYVLERAGVTLDEWLAEKPNQRGGAREKAHEWFANAFEVYLSEGKAPNARLKGVFERARKFLMDIYDDIQNQLGIELTDEDREFFDNLLTSPGDETQSVEDFAVNEFRAKQQIAQYKEQLRQQEVLMKKEMEEYHAEEDRRDYAHKAQQDFLTLIAQNEPELYKEYMERLHEIEEGGVDTYHLDPDAVIDVYAYYQALEEQEVKQTGRKKYKLDKDVDAVFQIIKKLGYISGKDAIEVLGEETAKKIARKWTRLWSGKTHGEGKTLAYLADKLVNMGFEEFYPEFDITTGKKTSAVQKLVHWLKNAQRTYKLFDDLAPNVEVNEQTFDAFIELEGKEETIRYLKERKAYLAEILSRGKNATLKIEERTISQEEMTAETALIDRYIEELTAKPEKVTPPKKNTRISVLDLRNAARLGSKFGEAKERIVQNIQHEISDKRVTEQHQKEIEQLNSSHTQEVQQLEELHKQKIAELKDKQAAELQKFKEKQKQDKAERKGKDTHQQEQHKQNLAELRAKHKEELTQLKTSHKQKIAELNEQHKQKITELNERHTEELKQARQQAKERLSELREKHREKLKAFKQQARQQASERLSEVRGELKEKEKIRRAEREEKINARYQKKIDRYQQRIDKINEARKQARNKAGISRMVKRIIGMGKSQSISYGALQEIKDIISRLNRSKNITDEELERRELLRTFLDMADNEGEQYTSESEFAEEHDITPEELENFTREIRLADMTIGEVKALFDQVKEIYRRGRIEFENWKAERDNRRNTMTISLTNDIISTRKAPSKRTIKSRDDIVHKYVLGPLGGLAAEYGDAVLTPGRFLEGLGENFRKLLDDGFTQRKSEALYHISRRTHNVLSLIQQCGLSIPDIMKNAITINGEKFTWSEVMGIYTAIKNRFSRNAVVWGNFVINAADSNKLYATEDAAMAAINRILDLINKQENSGYKQVAEFIMHDFDVNFDRINEAEIRDFNRGMDKQDNYTPIFRLRRQTSQGFMINSETEEMVNNTPYSQVFQKVADGFTRQRLEINPQKQEPISLNLLDNWARAVTQQEYNAALGGYAADLFSALLTKGGENGSVQELIKQRIGDAAWATLRSIYNASITDNSLAEAHAGDKFANWFIKNRSYAYVAFNLGSMLAQTTSYFLALPQTNHFHLMRSLGKFMSMVASNRFDQFMESVYQYYPELRYSGGDPTVRAIQQGQRYNSFTDKAGENVKNIVNTVRAFNDKYAYAGVQLFDRVTKAIVFDAAYQSNIDKGYSHEEAVRLAIRVVQDTQPASSAREMTRINRESRGLTKLMFTQFMNALAPVFNVAVVDVYRNVTSGTWNGIAKAFWSITGAALAIGFGGFIKDAMSGRLPTYQELPNGTTDDWEKWFADTEFENFLNMIPIFNIAATSLYRYYTGQKGYRGSDKISEPFEAAAKAIGKAFSGDKEKGSKGMPFEDAVKAVSLLVGGVPFSGLRQLMRVFGFVEDN